MSLILRPQLAKMIHRGAKTTHRIKPRLGRHRPQVGDSIAVQAKYEDRKETLCNIEVLESERRLLHEITDAELKAEGWSDRGEFFQWFRETYEGITPPASTMEPPADTEVWVIRFQLDDRRYPTSRHSTTDQDEDSDAAHGYAHTPSSYDSAQAVPRNVQEQISRGDMPSPGQRRFDLERSQRAAKRLAKPPWEQIKDELDALRAESPSDSQMYEAKVADLARRIAAKRRRRAA